MMIEKIKEIAKEAGRIMLEAKRPRIMEKAGHANFCTETDEKIQAFLMERLKAVIPEASFLGEEDGQDVFTAKAFALCWIPSTEPQISSTLIVRLLCPLRC